MDEQDPTLEYATPGTFRRRIPRSLFAVVAILACAALAAVIEFRPALLPQTGLLHHDRRGIPSLLVGLFAIIYIFQRTREDARWPCGGLVLLAIAGAGSLTLFSFQCILWREQVKYRDASDVMTVLPVAGAAAAFALAAVGRRLAVRHGVPRLLQSGVGGQSGPRMGRLKRTQKPTPPSS